MTIISFDEIFAISVGISVTTWNYILLSLVSVLTVASFEVLGSVLVIALFIFPPATAFLLTKRLEVMFVLSLIFSVLTIFLGYYLSVWQGGSSAASIVIVQGIIFTLALIYNKKVASVNS
jgi:manganese/zinc/iron transport system permease protein